MKKAACSALAGFALLFTSSLSAIAGEPYYPYQSYDEYHRKHSPDPPPSEPAAPPEPPSPSKPPPASEFKPSTRQPLLVTQAPDFLFPPELDFGVAVGVPYDMYYLSGTYYYLQGGSWHRSPSYRGPWTVVGLNQLPAKLRKYDLVRIRELRNREFATFWKNKAQYQGKVYNPGKKPKELQKKGR